MRLPMINITIPIKNARPSGVERYTKTDRSLFFKIAFKPAREAMMAAENIR